MKKLLIILLLSISFISCTKEDVPNCEGCNPNCGEITAIVSSPANNYYHITIKRPDGIAAISDRLTLEEILKYKIGDHYCVI